jgi:5-hydroxyisourate hydrolase
MSQLTTHILDTTKGKPAANVTVVLFQQQNDNWRQVALGTTNEDGRISDLLQADVVMEPGIYKLRFDTKAYFDSVGVLTFYPYVEISFSITGPEHYHVPLLLNGFGYTTYRGS